MLLLLFTQHVAAQDKSSPAFSRQVEPDELNDLRSFPPTCANISGLPEIRAASYFSDGENLSATLWLSKPVNQIHQSYYTPRYIMIVDVNPSTDVSKSKRINLFDLQDYQVVITPDIHKKAWEQQIHELSDTNATRLLNVIPLNQTSVFEKDKPYIKLSFDLGNANYPQTYSLIFVATYIPLIGEEGCIMADLISPPAYIPKSEFDLAIRPPIVNIRPGETKAAELTINSSSAASS